MDYQSTDYKYHQSVFFAEPRSLGDPMRLAERQAMLAEVAAVQPLRTWSLEIVRARVAPVPDFDPADAGVHARVLFLLEAPGPMAATIGARVGSGFISCDNDDATAEATWRARAAAGLHDGALHWNIVPWYLGPASVKPRMRELQDGASATVDLLGLLPGLEVVIVAGRYAQRGWDRWVQPVVGDRYRVIRTWHPSPRNMTKPDMRAQFFADVANAVR